MPAAPRKGWAPQAGSQQLFLEAPWDELLYHGTRGPGKSLALLMGFAQHVGRGFGEYWRGVIFREQAVELPDLVAKSKMWFRDLFPDARFIGGSEHRKWVFAGGEELMFRHITNIDGYDAFHGSEIPYIAFDELCNWTSGEAYLAMRSCVRSTGPKHMPRQMRAACNPWGVGRGWVKARFIDPAPDGTPIYETFENPITGETITRSRVALRGTIWENKILLEQDPAYLANLLADPDPNRKKAWLHGSWDAVSGGIFEGRWDERYNVVLPFKIPKGWMIDRAFDDGHTSPYAVGWFAESDGSPATMADGTTRHFPKGTVFMIAEYYGWNGKPNEGIKHLIREKAEVILEVEAGLKRTLLDGHAIYPGPADPAIYNVQEGKSIGDQMAANGVSWKRADKGSGSRVAGWQQLGSMMQEARSSPMERPAFFVFSTCRNFLRTVPTMVRDRKDPDDADTTQEDHCFTADTRIVVRHAALPWRKRLTVGDLVGHSGFVVGGDGRWHAFRDVRLTRRGAEIVRLRFSDGSEAKCTPDHLFLTASGEWVKAGHMAGRQCRAWSLSRTPSRNFVANGITSALSIFNAKGAVFIGRFGRLLTAQFRRAGTFITSTGTGPTTRLRILTASLVRRICAITGFCGLRNCRTAACPRPERRPRYGTRAMGVVNGIASTIASMWPGDFRPVAFGVASTAGLRTKSCTPIEALPDSARTTASRPGGGRPASTKRSGNVQPAVRTSPSTVTGRPAPVRENAPGLYVVGVEPAGRADVYCLTVPTAGSFTLANGAVVHNCGDMVRYRVMAKDPTGVGVMKLPRVH